MGEGTNKISEVDLDIAVKVENISKKFSKNLKRSMMYGLKDIGCNVLGMRTKSHRLRRSEFWAVDDVSFKVKKGKCLGIIGPNGSGKSTILKMLNGIYWPDKGKITINGKVGALIEVGAGFHPMLTGRENIYLNSAILGMTKEEVDGKFDDIVEFADIGDFIDTPVKYYSSGMFVRLGFAVAAHCDPDILLVDEVLAVGDTAFRRKSSERMKKLIMDRNKSIILCSHDLQLIGAIADEAILLKNGKILASGNTREVVSKYDLLMRPQDKSKTTISKQYHVGKGNLVLVNKHYGYEKDEIIIQGVWLESSNGKKRTHFSSEEDVAVCISFKIPDINIQLGFVWVAFINEYGINCMGARLQLGEQGIPKILPTSGILRVWFRPLQLTTSSYKLDIVFFDHAFTVPYAQGHYGYIKVVKDIPTRIPGDNTPICWPPGKWNLESSVDREKKKK